MRTTDKPEDMAPLPPPIRKPPMPEPHRKVADGVWQAPDGKFHTDLPPPPPETIYELYGMVAP